MANRFTEAMVRFRHRGSGLYLLLALTCGRGFPARGEEAALAPVQPQAAEAMAPVAGLAARIREFIQAPRFAAASWGIKVVSLDSGRVLFEHQADKYFIPASNAKLFTAAMALQDLGPEFRIRTSLYGSAQPGADGRLPGDLVLFGRGDPTLMKPWTGGPSQPDPLESLAVQLRNQGVRTIQGDLVGDDSFFAAPPYAPGWEWEDLQFAYGAEPTALTIHHNVVDLWVYPAQVPGQPCWMFAQPGQGLFSFDNRTSTGPAGTSKGVRADRPLGETTITVTGSLAAGAAPARLTVTVRDSALYAARLLERALARHGIQVLGRVRSIHAQDRATPLDPGGLVELGHLDSPRLQEILDAMMKDSLNPYAQLLLLQAGARRAKAPGQDSVQRGLGAMAAWMAKAGLEPGSVVLEDGAGGSRKNLVKPAAIVQLLAYMDHQPEAAAFRDTLAIAGMDGTLRNRMDGTAAQGNLRAKTGTLRNTHALSGYVTRAGGERLAFAIMLNNYRYDPGPARAGAPRTPAPQADLDAIAAWLASDPGQPR